MAYEGLDGQAWFCEDRFMICEFGRNPPALSRPSSSAAAHLPPKTSLLGHYCFIGGIRLITPLRALMDRPSERPLALFRLEVPMHHVRLNYSHSCSPFGARALSLAVTTTRETV